MSSYVRVADLRPVGPEVELQDLITGELLAVDLCRGDPHFDFFMCCGPEGVDGKGIRCLLLRCSEDPKETNITIRMLEGRCTLMEIHPYDMKVRRVEGILVLQTYE